MKNHVKINRNKEKQLKKRNKVNLDNEIYKLPGNYKVFTVKQMSKTFLNITVKTPYNHIIYTCSDLSELEASYLIRSSDLLILTVGCDDIDRSSVEMIKRCMPSTIIVYSRKYKGIANGLSKIIGDVKICEISMLKYLLETFETVNTQLCMNRPFMVTNDYIFNNGYIYISGFMKQGLRTSRVILNGLYEGIIEEVEYEGCIINGEELNGQEDERLVDVFEKGIVSSELDQSKEIEESNDNKNKELDILENEDNEISSISDSEYNDNDDDEKYLGEEYDLITKYKDYCGIMNPATCTFSNQGKPEYYRDLIFIKNLKYAQNLLVSKNSRLSKNSVVKLKIRVAQNFEAQFIVMFGLFEFEEKNTILNYQFSGDKPLAKTILVDNGYRIYEAQTIISCNLAHNLFQEDSGLTHGVVSFIGPFSYYLNGVNAFSGDETKRLMNGESKDRIFFECVKLKGRPIKIYKRYCVIKGMFYSKKQVEYFNDIKIETKSGDRGFIKKSLGTKGLFKAYFTCPVKHNDVIIMSLYKRIFL